MTRDLFTPRHWLAGALAVLALLGGILFWWHGRQYDDTDDGYVGADVVQIASQVSGPVKTVAVTNNSAVVAHQLLFVIDPTPYRLKVAAAQATLAQAQGALATAEVHRRAARAAYIAALATARSANHELARTTTLVKAQIMSRAALDQARAASARANALVMRDRADLAQNRISLATKGVPARIRAAKAALALAERDLANTRVTAPADGTIAALGIRPGSVIEAGTPLFAVIENGVYWVDANFKETDIAEIHPGQTADITIDMYPGHPFRGTVESVSGASGTAFSLLPPENATGNWVKVTQRVPVRIRIDHPNPARPLRIGTTASVSIHVKS